MTRSHAFFLTLPAKIGRDTNSHKLVVAEARFWPQRGLAIRTMTQDLIGCCNYRKLKALIPLEAVFADDPLSAVRGILLPFLLFYGLLVAKYALICAMVIQKIQMAVQIFSGVV